MLDSQLVLGVLAGVALFYVIRVVRAMREGVRWLLRAVLISVLVFFLGLLILPALNLSSVETQQWSFVAALLTLALVPKRSRYVPAHVKRQVIARDLKRKKYDPKKHHIGHLVPFSKGGSNTADNLRVMSKEENLRRGAKMPRVSDWF